MVVVAYTCYFFFNTGLNFPTKNLIEFFLLQACPSDHYVRNCTFTCNVPCVTGRCAGMNWHATWKYHLRNVTVSRVIIFIINQAYGYKIFLSNYKLKFLLPLFVEIIFKRFMQFHILPQFYFQCIVDIKTKIERRKIHICIVYSLYVFDTS